MRPLKPADAIRAIQITTRFPAVHGAPVHLGMPELIGIKDIMKPDWGALEAVVETAVAVLGAGAAAGIPAPVIVVVVCCVLFHVFLTRTTVGRDLYAVGGSQYGVGASPTAIYPDVLSAPASAGARNRFRPDGARRSGVC